MKPKISIVIPCYNDKDFVKQSIESALYQTYQNKEIIVVDDGSNKETKIELKKFAGQVNLLLTQENKGPSAARNLGIGKATGEVIVVLDSDDFFAPTFCEKGVKQIIENQEIKLVSCYAKWFNDTHSQIYKPRGGTIKDYLKSNVALGNAMFLKSEWERVGGYDEKMTKGYEDWEFYINLHKNGGKTYIIPEVLFNYRHRLKSRSKKASLYKYDLLEYIYVKHSSVFKENFNDFISDWLQTVKKSESFKQQVMDSFDYKIGNKILAPFRFIGLFKK